MVAEKKIIPKINERFRSEISQYKFLIKPFVTLTAIFLIGIIALLRTNYNYLDDSARVLRGYKGWDDFSRFLSNFLSPFIHAGNYLTDVSPLPQIIAAFIMGLSAAILIYIISENKKFSWWNIFAVIPLGLSPYFLQCFSYKFDSPYMALSVFASVFPLLFRNHNKILYFFSAFIGILMVCTTYQAASGIFPLLVLLISFKRWNHNKKSKDIIKFIVLSASAYLLGLIIFMLFIFQPIDNSYVSLPSSLNFDYIISSLNNLRNYFHYVLTDFKRQWILIIVLICIGFVYVCTMNSKRNKVLAFFVSILTLAAMAFLTFGLYPFLANPLYDARAMYGFGAFLAAVAVTISSSKKAYLFKILCIGLSWIFFVFGFTYANALKEQSEYADFRITAVVEDLNELDVMKTDNTKTIQVTGTIGYSPIIENMPDTYQILRRLVPKGFEGGYYWGGCKFVNYYNIKNIVWTADIGEDISEYDLPVLKDTMYHTIKGNEKYILIELK